MNHRVEETIIDQNCKKDFLQLKNGKATFVIFKKLSAMRKKSCNKITYRYLQIQSNYQK